MPGLVAVRWSPDVRAYLPAIAWAAVVWLLGGLNNMPSVPSGLPLDKLAHLGMYALLGWLLGRGWVIAQRPARVWLIVLALVIGAADEARQSAIPRRATELGDFAADAAGIIAGFLIATRRGARRSSNQTET